MRNIMIGSGVPYSRA